MSEVYADSNRPGTRLSRISWAAVFAGVVITLVIQALLSLLGIGIGAANIHPLQETDPGRGFGFGAAIWFLASTLIAVYVGAMVAGKMSDAGKRSDRTLHGLLTWGTSAMIGVVALSTSAGALLGGAGSLLGGATAMGRNQPVYARAQQNGQADALSPTGREVSSQMDEQQTRTAADKAARRVSQAALWSFVVLALSGVVARFGAQPKGGAPDTAALRTSKLHV